MLGHPMSWGAFSEMNGQCEGRKMSQYNTTEDLKACNTKAYHIRYKVEVMRDAIRTLYQTAEIMQRELSCMEADLSQLEYFSETAPTSGEASATIIPITVVGKGEGEIEEDHTA